MIDRRNPPAGPDTTPELANVYVAVDVTAAPFYRRAQRALTSGDAPGALAALVLAHRLAPADAHIALALGDRLLQTLDPLAAPTFRSVLGAHDVLQAWLGLMLAEAAVGRLALAADALHRGLQGHVVYEALALSKTFNHITKRVGACAWCGLLAPGKLLVGPSAAWAVSDISVSSDSGPVSKTAQTLEDAVLFNLGPLSSATTSLAVTLGGKQALGSPIDLARINQVEGCVEETDQGGLLGWAWYPRQPQTIPEVLLSVDGQVRLETMALQVQSTVNHRRPCSTPRVFGFTPDQLAPFQGPVRIEDRFGTELLGSPMSPALWPQSAMYAAQEVARQWTAVPVLAMAARHDAVPSLHSVPAHLFRSVQRSKTRARSVDIVIPVHNARKEALACISSVKATVPAWARIVVVDDASTDRELINALDQLNLNGDIHLLRQNRVSGFPRAANRGMRFSRRDVLLLNSDTLVCSEWVERLRLMAYRDSSIGTVTPLSNNGSILSYPRPCENNDSLTTVGAEALSRIAWAVNREHLVEIPTAIGFCMFVKRVCLEEVGLFREDVFGQGYGEENDFSLRARFLGWRHMAATGIYITHLGSKSFLDAKSFLVARNIKILNRIYPGYDEWLKEASYEVWLREARRRIDRAIWDASSTTSASVLFITHGRKGGVNRVIEERANALKASGIRVLVLSPAHGPQGRYCCTICDQAVGDTPNMWFDLPDERPLFMSFILAQRPLYAEIHHLEGHDHSVIELLQSAGVVYDYIIHDYALFCPRFFLVHGRAQYCGEPPIQGCEDCIADYGQHSRELIPVSDLVKRSCKELRGARRVIAPSSDVALRVSRHFPGVAPIVEPWERDPSVVFHKPELRGPRHQPVTIAIIGAISPEKGFEVVLALCRDAQLRSLPIEFVVIGYTCGDDRLLDCGHVTITGPYVEEECDRLVQRQGADLCLLPSVCPETWCFALTSAWRAGLKVVAFDIGTPAARIRANSMGFIVPLGVPPAILNDRLLQWSREARNNSARGV